MEPISRKSEITALRVEERVKSKKLPTDSDNKCNMQIMYADGEIKNR